MTVEPTVKVAVFLTLPKMAETTTFSGSGGFFAWMPKVAVFSPSGIEMLAGRTTKLAGAAVSLMVMPPAGAGPFKVTVPVVAVPSNALDGEMSKDDNASGTTVRTAVLRTPFAAAERVTPVNLGTDFDWMLKVPVVAPGGMRMLDGTEAALLGTAVKVTTCPPPVAGAVRTTRPVERPPALTVDGETVRAEAFGVGFILSRTFWKRMRFVLAEMVTLVGWMTVFVRMANDPKIWPFLMTTTDGILTKLPGEADRKTCRPSEVEVVFRTTMPTAVSPLVNGDGATPNDETPNGGVTTSSADRTKPEATALIVTATGIAGKFIFLVRISKVAVVEPALTMRLAGIVTRLAGEAESITT